MLENRVRKNRRRLGRVFERAGVTAFRLYDWDIPELRLVIDWYGGHLVVAEYERDLTRSVDGYLETLAAAAAQGAGVAPEQVVVKRRRTRPTEGPRYRRLAAAGQRIEVREGDLRFWVNLTDYIDTGLFAHHRITRALVGAEASGADLLNLFGYTGAFTCAAAAGGARASVTVNASQTYLDWAADNLALNHLAGPAHQLECDEVGAFLERAQRQRRRFDQCVVNPPSFSDRGLDHHGFEVVRDHPVLLARCLLLLAPGGVLWFSTNHARFEPRFEQLAAGEIRELTAETTPPDFRRAPHRVWRMTAAPLP